MLLGRAGLCCAPAAPDLQVAVHPVGGPRQTAHGRGLMGTVRTVIPCRSCYRPEIPSAKHNCVV